MHSFVDSFFLGKKALVKERLRQSMETVVDGLFEEMVEQVKEMLLPPKEGVSSDQVKPSGYETTSKATPAKATSSSFPVAEMPKNKLIFATKSKHGPSSSAASQPFSGLYKRMAEDDGVNNNQPNKKKAITVELQIDGPLDDENDYGDLDNDDVAGGGEIEQLDKDTAQKNTVTASDSKQQQPKQTAEKKVACPEPGCGKLLASRNLKRHLRTHNNAKPFGCNYSGCSLEFSQREHAIRHILNVHLKKPKPNDAEDDGNEEADEPDPAAYLTVKEELL